MPVAFPSGSFLHFELELIFTEQFSKDVTACRLGNLDFEVYDSYLAGRLRVSGILLFEIVTLYTYKWERGSEALDR